MQRKEVCPEILAAAKSYAARFSEKTPVAHFVTFWREDGRTLASIDYNESRAQSWAYQSSGECFAILPIAGTSGATIAHVKPLTAAQWRARLMGRR